MLSFLVAVQLSYYMHLIDTIWSYFSIQGLFCLTKLFNTTAGAMATG